MSRFISDKTIKVDLGEGDSIELKEYIPFEELVPIISQIDKDNEASNMKIALPLLESAIVRWNLKDENGVDVLPSKENIKKLNTPTIVELVQKCTELYFPEKKN